MITYSKKEVELFTKLGYSNYLYVEPVVLYNIIAMDCFLSNKSGQDVDSIRNCIKAMQKECPKRLSKEFDNLIN
jgi:hypothetical protein